MSVVIHGYEYDDSKDRLGSSGTRGGGGRGRSRSANPERHQGPAYIGGALPPAGGGSGGGAFGSSIGSGGGGSQFPFDTILQMCPKLQTYYSGGRYGASVLPDLVPSGNGDPLIEIRALQNTLEKKKEEFLQHDEMFKLKLAVAAIERLERAQDEVKFYTDKKKNVAANGGSLSDLNDLTKNARDVKEKVFASIHLDLIMQPRAAAPESPRRHGHPEDPFQSSAHVHNGPCDCKSKKKHKPKRAESAGGKQDDVCRDGCCRRGEFPTGAVPASASHRSSRRSGRGSSSKLPKCSFCQEQNELFEEKDLLNGHYREKCPVLTICQYCNRRVEVAKLDEHRLKTCPFLKDSMSRCPICTQSCSEEELQKHQKGFSCPGSKPERGSAWCPLCDSSVAATEGGWREHLIGRRGCRGNDRKLLSGVPDDPNQITKKNRDGGSASGSGGGGSGGGGSALQPKRTGQGPMSYPTTDIATNEKIPT